MRVALYLRISKETDPAGNGVSLEVQRERLRAYSAAQDPPWEVVREYVDDGQSGATLVRPAVQEMLNDMRRRPRPFDLVAAYRFDRLSRSLRDFLEMVAMMERARVGLVSYSEKLDTSTAHGRFAVQVLVGAAELERSLIAARTREALAHKRRLGVSLGEVPLGFRRRRKALEPVAAELEVVRRVLGMRDGGMPLRAIARALAAGGVPTKKGGSWSAEHIRKLVARRALYEPFL